MTSLAFIYWEDACQRIGYLDEFPDYLTQGESFADLKSHLIDLRKDLLSGDSGGSSSR